MINTTDFTGKWAIAQNSYTKLQPYITRYEDRILVDLMGKDLADLFLLNTADPQWDDFKDIGFGLTSLLVGLVYFEYVRDLPYSVTNKNVVYTLEENGGVMIPALMLRQRYNECVRDWREMQVYLRANFPDFAGKNIKYLTD